MKNGASMNRTEFYGYVTAKLEMIHEDIRDIKEEHSGVELRVGKIEQKCAGEQVLIAGIRDELRKEARSQGNKSGALAGGVIAAITAIALAVLKALGLY